MELNIANIEIEPKRHTFGHIAKRFGEDRPASRYEEAVYDGQATENFHYRPTYEPEFEIYDVKRTVIKMDDWYKLLDPRKFHYMTYVSTRANQNAASKRNFELIEERLLTQMIPEDIKEIIYNYLTPLRHYFYGVNLNNLSIVSRGYGTALNSASLFYASDSLGNSQHLTKIVLLLSDNNVERLEKGKNDWMNDPKWQPLRKTLEDIMVVKDPIEILVSQNLILNGLLVPLLITQFSNTLVQNGHITVSLLTEFISQLQEESIKWLDSIVKVMAEESEENNNILSKWSKSYLLKADEALAPLSDYSDNTDILPQIRLDLENRLKKIGLKI
ncbi:ferritin family protein [Halarcobacter anaerophilus]|uniref:Phenol hydroxylase n=1 Tax=Halarcobacter anaerophilus TaxID=877500 RepID=A0A4Q0XXE9_9BACT|nr:phenol hydroxylase [Halarcobacter anaerophilus]QDF28730.1 phenol hydroxylase, oxygenase component P1 [Halarcobacter anaerophilus]RXJ61903.1 phenol hydroxylase [Halarcobacter anaerophilus]